MSNNLKKMEKDLRAFAKRCKDVKYTQALLYIFLMTGAVSFTATTAESIEGARKEIKSSITDMKKIAIALGLGALAVSCTNAKLVNYNTDRLDNIEAYLKENKFVKPSDNLEKLKNEGQIEYTTQYKSLEREADAWKESQEQ